MLENKKYQEHIIEGQAEKIEYAHKLIDEVMDDRIKIGEGQNANVYFSAETKRQKFCVKHLKESPGRRHYQSIDWEMRLQEEARQAGVRVPQPVLALITEDDDAFMVMETIKGSSLQDIINGSVEVPAAYRENVFWNKLEQMMVKLHENNLYHRDLHSGNIMIDADSGDPILIDFGWSAYVPGGDNPYREINTNINHQEDFPNDDVQLKNCKRQFIEYLTKSNK